MYLKDIIELTDEGRKEIDRDKQREDSRLKSLSEEEQETLKNLLTILLSDWQESYGMPKPSRRHRVEHDDHESHDDREKHESHKDIRDYQKHDGYEGHKEHERHNDHKKHEGHIEREGRDDRRWNSGKR